MSNLIFRIKAWLQDKWIDFLIYKEELFVEPDIIPDEYENLFYDIETGEYYGA